MAVFVAVVLFSLLLECFIKDSALQAVRFLNLVSFMKSTCRLKKTAYHRMQFLEIFQFLCREDDATGVLNFASTLSKICSRNRSKSECGHKIIQKVDQDFGCRWSSKHYDFTLYSVRTAYCANALFVQEIVKNDLFSHLSQSDSFQRIYTCASVY